MSGNRAPKMKVIFTYHLNIHIHFSNLAFTCNERRRFSRDCSVCFYFKLTEGIAEEAHCSSNFARSGKKVEREKGREEDNGKAQNKSKMGERCAF
jgi:hypothetical protein